MQLLNPQTLDPKSALPGPAPRHPLEPQRCSYYSYYVAVLGSINMRMLSQGSVQLLLHSPSMTLICPVLVSCSRQQSGWMQAHAAALAAVQAHFNTPQNSFGVLGSGPLAMQAIQEQV